LVQPRLLSLNKIILSYYPVFALSGLGVKKNVSRVKRGRWNKKVEKHWSMACKSITSKNIQSDIHYIAKNTSLQLATQAVTDEQRNFLTTAILLHTSVLWFSRIASILADSCVVSTSCMNIVPFLHSVWACLVTVCVIVLCT